MLSTRLWMGSVLVGLVVGMLVVDEASSFHPFQFTFQLILAVAAAIELRGLFGPDRPILWRPTLLFVVLLNVAPWWITGALSATERTPPIDAALHAAVLLPLLAAATMTLFIVEMRTFREPGGSIERMARSGAVIAYLGLLPSFFASIRWLFADSGQGTTALALAIFVPKGCDIGAYFTGQLFGRTKMTPVLSPKKTWEGAAGGVALAVVMAAAIDRLGSAPVLAGSWILELAFGVTMGVAGMLGDLAESLLKRDCQQKDASQAVPGFGGVLDVVDAVIFAAPVAYIWYVVLSLS